MFINSKELLKKSSSIASGEAKDCLVYAFASAFDLDYDTAHAEVKQRFKREDREGTKYGFLLQGLQEGTTCYGKKVTEVIDRPTLDYKVYSKIIPRSIRLSTFVAQKGKGTYIVLVRGHAIAIKDGVMVDNRQPRPSALVTNAFKVEDV